MIFLLSGDMKNVQIIFLSFFMGLFSMSSILGAEKSESKGQDVVGRFIKPSKEMNLPFEYYFLYEDSKGQKVAFPIVKEGKTKLKGVDLSKLYHVKVKDSSQVIFVGEKKSEVKVLSLISFKAFNMADLALPKNMKLPEEPVTRPGEQDPRIRPEFRINDKVANTAIFTAGALLLGAILAD